MNYVQILLMFGGMIVQLFVLFLILSAVGKTGQPAVPAHAKEVQHH